MTESTTARREIASLNAPARKSLDHEKAEFLRHLQALGVHLLGRPDGQGEQKARCWNPANHAHGDRTPSLSVNPDSCVWYCHGCDKGGGLLEMREVVGWTPTRSGRNSARLAAVEMLADFDVDPLDYLPEKALQELRERTGRYKKDRTVTRHLRVMVAAACRMFRQAETETGFVFSRGVRFTAADAHACGIRAEVFSDFLPLLEAVGFTVTPGESGRLLTHKAAETEEGFLLATKLGLADFGPTRQNRNKSLGTPPPISQPPQHIPKVTRSRQYAPQAVIASRLATKADKRAWSSLSQCPALADLLVDLGTFEKVREHADGSTCQPGSRFIWDLVNTHGPNVRRTIRKAEVLGLVSVWRDAKAGRHSAVGFVGLTEEGLRVVERDIENGRARMETEAEQIRAKWRKVLADRKEALRLKREEMARNRPLPQCSVKA